MDAQMKALHKAVNRLLRARQQAKKAEKARIRAERTTLPQWQMFDRVDNLEQTERHAQACQREAEEEVLDQWHQFSSDYATPDPSS